MSNNKSAPLNPFFFTRGVDLKGNRFRRINRLKTNVNPIVKQLRISI